FEYTSNISYSLNGVVNAYACLYFFRGVFKLCCKKKHNPNDSILSSEIKENDGKENELGQYRVSTQSFI
ncbi:MAG: hypothetical protein MJ252_06230, partial [archaeon]|nr:hypothetical protein [archaeon]